MLKDIGDKLYRFLSHLDDTDQAIPATETYLRRHHIYAKRTDNQCYFELRRFLFAFAFSILGGTWLLYVYDVHTRNGDANFMNELVLGYGSFLQMFGIITMALYRDDGLRTLDDIKRIRDETKCNSFIIAREWFTIVAKVSYYGALFVIPTVPLSYWVLYSECNDYNAKHNITDVCGVIAPVSFFHLEDPFRKGMYLLFQIAGMMYVLPVMTQFPIAVFCVHEYVSVMVEHQKHMIRSIGKHLSNKEISDKIANIVRYHLQTIRFMEKLNHQTSVGHCLYLFAVSTLFTLVSYQILTVTWQSPIFPCFHLFFWFFMMLLNCTGAQRIKDTSLSIADAIYNDIEWFELDLDTQKKLLIIITYSQNRPMAAYTGPFGEMGLDISVLVAKGIYTLFVGSLSRSNLDQN